MRQEYKDRKNTNRMNKASQRAVYKEMEKNKPRDTAVEAFRHKPYKLDWKKEE